MATQTQVPLPPVSHSPGYYIRKRLLQNKPAMLGLTLVFIAFFIAFSGYLLLPDSTPNANDGIVSLQKQPAGFTVKLLRIPKANAPENVNIAEKWLFGAPAKFDYIPIENFRIENDFLVAEPYRSGFGADTSLLRIPLQKLVTNTDGRNQNNVVPSQIEKDLVETRTYWLGTDKA